MEDEQSSATEKESRENGDFNPVMTLQILAKRRQELFLKRQNILNTLPWKDTSTTPVLNLSQETVCEPVRTDDITAASSSMSSKLPQETTCEPVRGESSTYCRC